jgi:phage terminase large subunit GpA-like protein
MPEAAYASAGHVIADVLRILLPPERLTVPQYAAGHRWLRSKSGGGLERWTNEIASYLVEPAECLTSEEYLTVAVAGPGQCGKTSIAENWFQHGVASDPGDMLWYMQTETGIEGYVKDRINTMIDLHTVLRDNLGRRSVDDSLSFKKFTHMSVQFLSATENNLINKTARRIVADEIDAYPESLGDVMTLLDVRRQTYGKHSKIFALSHPDRAIGLDPTKDWTKGIMAVYGDSDRRVWYAACPHCEAWSSFTPIADRVYTVNYPTNGTLEEIEEEARLICPVNGCVINDRERLLMNVSGKWVALGQEIAQDGTVTGERIRRKTAGFWIVGLMSPFILGGIGGLARARVKAEREFEITGEDESLRNVVVKQFGLPYAPNRGAGTVDANTLAERAEAALQLGTVPEGVRFLTAAVDVQRGYFEYLVRGWGERGENWIVDRGRMLADPATSPDDWDKLLKQVFLKTYPLSDKSGRVMGIRGCGYDSGGEPGVTQQAYAAFARWRKTRETRYLGVQDGRQVYSITPLKGSSGFNAPKLIVTFPDTMRKANVKASSGTVPVAAFNPNLFKDDFVGQLQRGMPGPLYVHFPAELRSKEKPHVFFEQVVSEHRTKIGRWEKLTPNIRNEALDLMVMTHVLAHLHGLARIDWTRPPAFAAAWDTNSQITQPSLEPPGAGPSGSIMLPPKHKAISSIVSRLAH